MSVLFLEYPKCSTCQKAKKWLEAHQVAFEDRNIVTEHPTAKELAAWIRKSGMPVKKFFNTSGMLYRAQKLSERLPEMSEEEQIAVLASDGMLVKRPLVIGEGIVLTGFREKAWEEALL